MTSDKQIEANRRNARKSTGPKSPEGKDRASNNSMSHGILSREVVLPDEDEATFEELRGRLWAELKPVGELESLLVDKIIAAHWRLRRLGRVEAGIFAWERYELLADRAHSEARSYLQYPYKDHIEQMSNTPIITDAQKYDAALSKAEEMKAEQDTETATLGGTFIRDADKANAFSKLSRYETTIERSLYRALHELQRLQAARHTEGSVPPPAALDVDISGVSGEGS
jgi:hypothetical protein